VKNGGGGGWGLRAAPAMEEIEADAMVTLGLGRAMVLW